jgi:hypothetical protein
MTQRKRSLRFSTHLRRKHTLVVELTLSKPASRDKASDIVFDAIWDSNGSHAFHNISKVKVKQADKVINGKLGYFRQHLTSISSEIAILSRRISNLFPSA